MRTVILSEATLSALIEAHASMAAWHYELWRALRDGSPPRTPDEESRRAFNCASLRRTSMYSVQPAGLRTGRFVARLAADFPEVASTAKSISAPRLYVPPPPAVEAPPEIE